MKIENSIASLAGRCAGRFRIGRIITKIMLYLFLAVISFVFIFPFLYMLVTSVKSPYDLYDSTVNWIPRSFYYMNYVNAFRQLNFGRHFIISVAVTLLATLLHVFVDSYIAYGLSRYNFPGKNLLFFIVILSIIIPTQVIILPQYIQFVALHWKNTYLPIIVPILFGFGLRGGLFIFLFRQFFLGLPKAVEEAAKIDGCSHLQVYSRIALPMAKTSVLVCVVLSMVWHWNEYFETTIYFDEMEFWPLPSMLPRIYTLFEQTFKGAAAGGLSGVGGAAANVSSMISEGVVMAATFMVIVPVIIAYFFLQKQFMQGIERSGLVE